MRIRWGLVCGACFTWKLRRLIAVGISTALCARHRRRANSCTHTRPRTHILTHTHTHIHTYTHAHIHTHAYTHTHTHAYTHTHTHTHTHMHTHILMQIEVCNIFVDLHIQICVSNTYTAIQPHNCKSISTHARTYVCVYIYIYIYIYIHIYIRI